MLLLLLAPTLHMLYSISASLTRILEIHTGLQCSALFDTYMLQKLDLWYSADPISSLQDGSILIGVHAQTLTAPFQDTLSVLAQVWSPGVLKNSPLLPHPVWKQNISPAAMVPRKPFGYNHS